MKSKFQKEIERINAEFDKKSIEILGKENFEKAKHLLHAVRDDTTNSMIEAALQGRKLKLK